MAEAEAEVVATVAAEAGADGAVGLHNDRRRQHSGDYAKGMDLGYDYDDDSNRQKEDNLLVHCWHALQPPAPLGRANMRIQWND